MFIITCGTVLKYVVGLTAKATAQVALNSAGGVARQLQSIDPGRIMSTLVQLAD